MPKKRSRRSQRGDFIALFVVTLLALALGWWLLAPRRAPKTPVAQVTAVPAATVSPSAQPAVAESPATPSPAPLSTSTPNASPLPAVTKPPTAGAPKLALIVDDCGQWIATERGFLALNIPLTMSVLPDVHYTATIASEAAN
ncbi:MAG: hypothetical protein JO277_09045, partial [Candidatus Eremiobacteraeota bacterium]|nr:hypothetical protein [Candidatus Eremiobacteraeota bacterium]